MNILKRIRAFFIKENEQVSLELSAAEIKNGKAFLHPKGTTGVTYIIRSDDIEIRLNEGKCLTDKDVILVKKSNKKDVEKPDSRSKAPSMHNGDPKMHYSELERYKKKTFSVSLYQHEYDNLMNTIKQYGYRRADFILASANTATKGTMEREHKKLIKEHKQMRKEARSIKTKQKLEE